MMHQIYHQQPAALNTLRSGGSRRRWTRVIQRALAKEPSFRYRDWGRVRAGAVGPDHAPARAARASCRACSIRSASRCCARSISSHPSATSNSGRWLHRAKWQRYDFGHALYRKGEEGRSFHIIAKGELEVFRDGQKVAPARVPAPRSARLAYLAPSPRPAQAQHRRDRHRDGDDDLVHARDAGAGSARAAGTTSTRRSSACWCGACTPRTRRWPTRAGSCSRHAAAPAAVARRCRAQNCAPAGPPRRGLEALRRRPAARSMLQSQRAFHAIRGAGRPH